MASTNEFVVSNRVLQQESNAARSDHGNDFRVLGSRGPSTQSTMHAYDPGTGVIFFDEIQRNGVGCWKTSKPISAENYGSVDSNAEDMIYPSDLSVSKWFWIKKLKKKLYISSYYCRLTRMAPFGSCPTPCPSSSTPHWTRVYTISGFGSRRLHWPRGAQFVSDSCGIPVEFVT